MAKSRLELHEILVEILGNRNVYFQPPESFKLQYPCIVYERNDYEIDFADNTQYTTLKQYSVTFIGRDPDSIIPDKLISLPYCRYNRQYVTDNLIHDVFILYF